MGEYKKGDYSEAKLAVLVDMLVEHTEKINSMIKVGIMSGEEFTRCRDTLLAIQAEIKNRGGLDPDDHDDSGSVTKANKSPGNSFFMSVFLA